MTLTFEEEIKFRRDNLASRPEGHPEHVQACAYLAKRLREYYQLQGQVALLDEAICLGRKAVALQPDDHPDRALYCGFLAAALHLHYRRIGDGSSLNEAIELGRKAYVLSPRNNSSRTSNSANLQVLLVARFCQTGDPALLDEAITLGRESLELCPIDDPKRSLSYANLSASLRFRYLRTGNTAVLVEMITLGREALRLSPPGHRNRINSLENLAMYLELEQAQTGDVRLFDEIIALQRHALALQPAHSPTRAKSCGNLAAFYLSAYKNTGKPDLLDEAISLQRESVALCSGGNLTRASACSNLGVSLFLRYNHTYDLALLDEAIALEREAIALRPIGQHGREQSCANLAVLLGSRYQQTSDESLAEEIITLHREVLASRPTGHPLRAMSCADLAGSMMMMRYSKTLDPTTADECVALQREALMLCPDGHPDHARRCRDLAESLIPIHIPNAEADSLILDEVLNLVGSALASSSPSTVWRTLFTWSEVYLQDGSPVFSVKTALQVLIRLANIDVDSIQDFFDTMNSSLERIWLHQELWPSEISLVPVYSDLVDRLPLVTGFALGPASQLSVLKLELLTSIGSDACIAALLAECPAQAIELLDHAHGVIWSQALHQRNLQLRDLPQNMALELEQLLRAVATPTASSTLESHSGQDERYLTGKDVRHKQNNQIQNILRAARKMPGLERFMLGHTFETLREAARDHPIAVLVAARGHVFVLIISDPSAKEPYPLRLSCTSQKLSMLCDAAGQTGLRGVTATTNDLDLDAIRAMHISSRPKDNAQTLLAELWRHIVKPVVDYLQLQVRPAQTFQ
jgi:hypothetical protein